MRRISSKMTFFNKRVFPIMWFGFLAFFVLTAWGTGTQKQESVVPLILIPVVMAVFGYFIMKKLVFDLVDEVWDDGDALVIRNKGTEDRVSLSNIINVDYSIFTNPPRITLTLREPCVFGKEITFSPPSRLLPFAKHPIASELIERIDEQRRSSK